MRKNNIYIRNELLMTDYGNDADQRLFDQTLLYIFSTDEREKKRVVADEQGLAIWAASRLYLDTSCEMNINVTKNDWIYVVDTKGGLYVDKKVDNKIYHSSLIGNELPIAAGEIIIVKGKIKCINEESGHYAPKGTLKIVAKLLRLQGFDITTTIFLPSQHPKYNIRVSKEIVLLRAKRILKQQECKK